METVASNLLDSVRATGIANARPGEGADAIQGEIPGIVALPDSVEEVARLLAWANDRDLKVTPQGAGTRQDRGSAPARCDMLLDLSRVAGVVEHAAGDMTVVVRSGTRLDDLQEELTKAGQFLAIDPPFPGTVGGLIATGDSGSRRLRYGGVRDMLLGITFVRADGTIARAGSKVVKNVAGYDLPKLFTGALGTLGVVVEATFRLYPVRPASATVTCVNVDVREAAQYTAQILASGVVPTAIDFSAQGRTGTLAVRFETSPRAVRGQAERVATQISTPEIVEGSAENNLWAEFDGMTTTGAGDVLARLITTQSEMPTLIEQAQSQAEEAQANLSVRAHMGHGHALLRFHEPQVEAITAILLLLRAEAEGRQSSLVIWRAPQAVRATVDVWGDAGEGIELMRRIKDQFDPKHTLNAGRFVGGI